MSDDPQKILSEILAADMKHVNALILNRLESPITLIPQVASHLIEAGGKRIRPLLTLASAAIYGGDMKRAGGLAACVEFIHSATLLHDDVVDESAQRRGQSTANEMFGNKASILVGDFLFARAFQGMVEDGSLEVLRILSDASAVISQGEVMQLGTANNVATTLDDYIKVISAKTAALFAAACEVGPVIAGADKAAAHAMAEYGFNLGIAFQIADDALDYTADEGTLGKTVGDDFREGKMTAPLIFAIEKSENAEKNFWTRTIAEKKQTDADFGEAQRLIQKHNGIARGLDLAAQYGGRAREALAEAPDHELRAILDNLVAYSISRQV
ncbi:MAG: polyprenyl synthetase family protein [Alphaproteobacteria bacterium]